MRLLLGVVGQGLPPCVVWTCHAQLDDSQSEEEERSDGCPARPGSAALPSSPHRYHTVNSSGHIRAALLARNTASLSGLRLGTQPGQTVQDYSRAWC